MLNDLSIHVARAIVDERMRAARRHGWHSCMPEPARARAHGERKAGGGKALLNRASVALARLR